MDNAKPNERPWPAAGTAWSRRLEAPGALPGEGLTDKEAAWDKLYDRLGETPRRRTRSWLWAAAACLLLALIPAAFFLKERRTISHSRAPKLVIRPKATPKPGPARAYPPLTPALSTAPPSPLAHRTPLTTHSSKLTAHGSKLVAHGSKLPACSSLRSADSSRLIAQSSPLPAPRLQLAACSLQLSPLSSPLTAHGSQLTAQLPPANKQIRVVHINELEPAQPTPSMTGERLRPGRLQVRLTQPETFRPATTYNNGPSDHPIIPLKHIPNP